MAQAARLRIGIDVGGTFTDLVASDTAGGATVALKVPSTPQAPQRAVLDAVDALIERYPERPLVEHVAHSTTIATNALLGQINLELPRVGFLTTAGFRDVIEIGRQNRSEVYNLFVRRPRPLVAREDRIGVRERMDFRGNVITPLTDEEIARVVEAARAANFDAIAIGFLHAYANDAHERRVARALREAFAQTPVCASSELDPEYREYERFSTAVVNAALLPVMQRYLSALETGLRERGIAAPLYVMQSNGGMAAAAYAAQRPFTIVESGPASGVIAAAGTGRRLEIGRVLSFDMGGTTAKAGTIVDGTVQVVTEFEAAGSSHSGRSIKGSGYPVRFPFVDLAEVSAGGGTIAWIDDGGALRVGPLSAGADPGPACYGRSDRATVTDANVVLGRLNPVALLDGTFPIDARRSRDAVAQLASRLRLSVEATAAGIVRLVDTEMAKVLRIVTVERGLDPRDFTLVAFGGNGALHACALAEELAIDRAIVPARPGVFSAEGLLDADLRLTLVQPVLRESGALSDDAVRALFDDLERRAAGELREQGAQEERLFFRRAFDARYAGQSFELDVEWSNTVRETAASFHAKHRRVYGYDVPHEAVEFVSLRVTASAPLRDRPLVAQTTRDASAQQREVWIDGAFASVPVYRRDALHAGAHVSGPAIVEQYDATTVVAPEWQAEVRAAELVLTRKGDR